MSLDVTQWLTAEGEATFFPYNDISLLARVDARPSDPVSGVDREDIDREEASAMRWMNSRQVMPRRLPAGPTPEARSQVRTVVADIDILRPFSSPTMR